MQLIEFQKKKIAVYWVKEGEGVPLVLLHGFCEDSGMWEEWLAFLPNRSVVCIDLPGFGNSDMLGNLSIESMADAVNAVLENFSIKKCVLIGHSMGGYVSLAFAEKYPGKLSGLGMFHSHPYADSDEKKHARNKSIDFIKSNGHILYVRQLIPNLFAYEYTKGYPISVNKLIHRATKFDPTAIITAIEAMRDRPDRSEVLREIACPVLFIIGKLDKAIPYDASLAQAHLPAFADICVLPVAGHMGMFEAQRETAGVVRGFLNNIDLSME
jgi:pimeloyl-ACP methyl ester carboxylesterase